MMSTKVDNTMVRPGAVSLWIRFSMASELDEDRVTDPPGTTTSLSAASKRASGLSKPELCEAKPRNRLWANPPLGLPARVSGPPRSTLCNRPLEPVNRKWGRIRDTRSDQLWSNSVRIWPNSAQLEPCCAAARHGARGICRLSQRNVHPIAGSSSGLLVQKVIAIAVLVAHNHGVAVEVRPNLAGDPLPMMIAAVGGLAARSLLKRHLNSAYKSAGLTTMPLMFHESSQSDHVGTRGRLPHPPGVACHAELRAFAIADLSLQSLPNCVLAKSPPSKWKPSSFLAATISSLTRPLTVTALLLSMQRIDGEGEGCRGDL